MDAAGERFRKRHPGLVWSNPAAEDSVRIRAALLRPRFGQLLDIAMRFGTPRLRREWQDLVEDKTSEVQRAGVSVERILRNLEAGFRMLPTAANRVWEFLARQPALAGFVLLGDTGLSLRIAHRLSEDFDLAEPSL
jgi:hypothetical protein